MSWLLRTVVVRFRNRAYARNPRTQEDPVTHEPLPPAEPDDEPSSAFRPGVDQPADEVADAGEAAEAAELLEDR